MADLYRDHGVHDGRWDSEAARFVHLMTSFGYGRFGLTNLAIAEAMSSNLTTLGCTDPLVTFNQGVLLRSQSRHAESKSVFLRSAAGFEGTTYPRLRRAEMAARLASLFQMQDLRNEKEARTWIGHAARWWVEGLQDEKFTPADSPWLWMHLSDYWDQVYGHDAALASCLASNHVAIDPWLSNVIRGRTHISQAWKDRGSGWASTVTPEGWRGFGEHLQEARKLLVEAWTLRPDLPDAPALMISVVMGGCGDDGETPRCWFDRAMTAQMDYPLAYSRYRTSIFPRWGGSHDAMFAFAFECANTRRYDTLVPWDLLEGLREIDKDRGVATSEIWKRPEVYPALREVFEGYLSANPEYGLDYITMLAGCAWKCGLYDEAARHLARSGNRTQDSLVPPNFGVSAGQLRGEIAVRSGPIGAELARIAALEAHDPGGARAAYAELVARTEDPALKKRIGQLVADSRVQKEYASGGWVRLQPDPGFGWMARGTWSVEPDGAVHGTAQKNGLSLFSDVAFAGDFEMKADVEFARAVYRGMNNAGFYFASGETPDASRVAILLYREEKKMNVMSSYRYQQAGGRDCDVLKTNSLDVAVQGGRVTAAVNGRVVYRDEVVPSLRSDEPLRVWVGGFYWTAGDELRFRNLQIRRLDPGQNPFPPGDAGPARK